MIDNTQLEELWGRDGSCSTVVEFYTSDTTPTVDGFDPGDALACFACVSGITFMGRTYNQLVEKFGSIKRTISGEINKTSVTLNNLDRAAAQFEFQYGFEGLIMVVRLLDVIDSVLLSDTQILFVGRCEKVESGTKKSITVPATFIVGSMDVRIPRRKYGPDDNQGRTSDNPEFEGFIHMPQYGSFAYPKLEKRGGFLGWWNKKQVQVTQQFSSYSNFDANKAVPECFGQIQMLGVVGVAVDVGTQVRMRVFWCEGPIQDILNVRSIDPDLPLNPSSYAEVYGELGAANGPDDPLWPGPGNYSLAAHSRCQADNSEIGVSDPAPDIAAIIQGRKMYTPDASGNWSVFQWSDNAAAVVYFLLTDSNYYRLDPNWIDTEYFTETFNYNAELIFNTSVDDFIFVEEG